MPISGENDLPVIHLHSTENIFNLLFCSFFSFFSCHEVKRKKKHALKCTACNLLVEASFQVLQEELTWNKAMIPNLNDIAVVQGITQLCQSHVQFIHPEANIRCMK